MRFLKDLLFTDKHLIKGHVKTGGQRLSTFLNNNRKRLLEVEEAALITHHGGNRAQSSLLMARINDILFAYEMEESGDEGLRNLGGRDKAELAVQIHLASDAPLLLTGLVRKRALDSDATRRHDFLVLMKPSLKGFTAPAAPEYALIKGAPYLIVNRDRISIIIL